METPIRKTKTGTVVSDAMDKTAVVAVTSRVRHRKYGKIIKRTRRFYVHDSLNHLKVGYRVEIEECRPLSKLKRWRLVKILERPR